MHNFRLSILQSSFFTFQTAVQRYQTVFNNYQAVSASLLPLLVLLFVGSLSDRYGKKPMLVTVLIGFVAMGAVYTLVAFEDEWPVEVLFAGSLSADITGSWVVFNMAVYSFVADITTPENRTKRMGVMDFCWYTGSPLGTLLGGWLYRYAGSVAVFATSTVLWIICVIYTIVFINESQQPETVADRGPENTKCGPLRNVSYLFQTAFKKRPNKGRLYLLVLVLLKLGVFLIQGHQVYQWSRVALKWDATNYSTWSTADSIIHQLGMLGWVWFAEQKSYHDLTTLAGGIISIMLWSAVLACITNPALWWLVIIASVVGMLEGSMEPPLRSLLTSVSGPGEAGKILAFMGLLEAAWLSVDSTLYSMLYYSFIDTFIQIDFVVQASLALSLLPVVFWLKKRLTKDDSKRS